MLQIANQNQNNYSHISFTPKLNNHMNIEDNKKNQGIFDDN